MNKDSNLLNDNKILNENNFWDEIKDLETAPATEINTPIPLNNIDNNSNTEEEYYNLLCEYKKGAFSIIFNIIGNLIGLYLAYRTVLRLPYGIATHSFVFFYLIVAIIAIYETIIQLFLSKKKSKKVCYRYYKWLNEHPVVNKILAILRWVMLIVIIIFGFFSTFMDLDYKRISSSIKNTGDFLSLYNNRNYRNNNRNIRNQKYDRN